MVARAEKREETRRRILGAMKDALVTATYPSIRMADVAAAAGVSSQTVHAHFESKESLFLAACLDLGEELVAARGHVEPGDVAGIVRGLVRQYERYGDINWTMLALERESSAVAGALEIGRAGHRGWLEKTFEPVLPEAAAERRAALDGLYAATDVGTWKLLRRDLGLSRSRTREVMETLVHGVLDASRNEG